MSVQDSNSGQREKNTGIAEDSNLRPHGPEKCNRSVTDYPHVPDSGFPARLLAFSRGLFPPSVLHLEIGCHSMREVDQMAHSSAQLAEAPPCREFDLLL